MSHHNLDFVSMELHMKSDFTERGRFWIFLALCLYVPGIFRVSYQLDSENLSWLWAFIYPVLSTGLSNFIVLAFYFFQFLFYELG